MHTATATGAIKTLVIGLGLIALALLSQSVFAHGMSDADKLAIIEGGNWSYLRLGATHMLSGFDHLLFVFGIIFFLTSFKDIVKYITAFTIGHSVTLIYATFNGIQLNYYLIDAIIALSVCYIAFANLDGFRKYLKLPAPNMMVMIVGLGLIHGFGLSTRLQELPLSQDNLLQNILSFNVGIELGQIAALAVMLVLISLWRNRPSFKTFSVVANCAMIIAGGLLFAMQARAYLHSHDHDDHDHEETSTQQAATQSGAAAENAKTSADWKETITIEIPAKRDIEYKLFVKKGDTFEHAWKTDGPALPFDFHGEPEGRTDGYFESFNAQTLSEASAAHIATFAGTHGWYWDNRAGDKPVTVELKVKGEYRRLD